MSGPARVDGYLPIAAYGLVGDCRSAALVGVDGSVDWLCLPRFDDPSLFGRILDARRGGYWQIVPRGPYHVAQRYRDRSNVLQTVFTTRGGRVVVTDFMPVHPHTIGEHARPHRDPRLVRLVECTGGEMTLHSHLQPAPYYGAHDCSRFDLDDGRFHADLGNHHLCVTGTVPVQAPDGDLHLRCGEAAAFALVVDERDRCGRSPWSVTRARGLLRDTQHFWWHWIESCTYHGPYQSSVWRSALILKLMTYSPTGAIVAAPTTSLPEQVGGPRNWDYRFTWLRDASFTLYAFFQLGLTDEAQAFFRWLRRTGVGDHGAVDNLYTLDGTRLGRERVLEHLEGYRASAPVRVGNGAAHQLQLDVYGEVLDSAYLYARFGGSVSRSLWRDLRSIVDLAIDRWEEPDASIWEVRGTDRHFTYSKMMCWVAIDRGLRIAERFGLPHDAERWRTARRAVHRRVMERAWSRRREAFAQSFDSDVLDAAVLRMAQIRFLRDRDPRMQSTVEAVSAVLEEGALLRRYRVAESADGIHGDEGAFLMCSFWLVDALAHAGRLEDAERHFEHLLTFASPLGLFSEEADTRTGELLGNYPQAFTHLSLVGAAVNIERARNRTLGVTGLRDGR